jgi:hypothetical protein
LALELDMREKNLPDSPQSMVRTMVRSQAKPRWPI